MILSIYCNMVTVPHKMVGLERMSDYRGVTVACMDHKIKDFQFFKMIMKGIFNGALHDTHCMLCLFQLSTCGTSLSDTQ